MSKYSLTENGNKRETNISYQEEIDGTSRIHNEERMHGNVAIHRTN